MVPSSGIEVPVRNRTGTPLVRDHTDEIQVSVPANTLKEELARGQRRGGPGIVLEGRSTRLVILSPVPGPAGFRLGTDPPLIFGCQRGAAMSAVSPPGWAYALVVCGA